MIVKYKFFSADSSASIEKAVNDWVAKQPSPVNVRQSDTKMTTVKMNGKSTPVVTVGIWYD